MFRYKSFYINKSQPLGHGSYGAVYKAKCDQLPCAAKVIHSNNLETTEEHLIVVGGTPGLHNAYIISITSTQWK